MNLQIQIFNLNNNNDLTYILVECASANSPDKVLKFLIDTGDPFIRPEKFNSN